MAFLGLGLMGLPMATRIARAGFRVRLWNRTKRDLHTAIKAGAKAAMSIREAVERTDIIVIMVSNGDAVDEVLFSKNGVAESARDGASVVVMSSIPPDTAQRQANILAEMRISYVDAPVSGGEVGARDGALAIIAGGEEADLAAIAPVLAAMGKVTHVGPVGAGQVVKLANQLIVGVTIGAVAEALHLTEAAGADMTRFASAVAGGFADSNVLTLHGARMVAGNFAPGAHALTQLKDLRTASRLAESHGLCLPMLREATELYEALCQTELAECDHSVLFKWLSDGRRLNAAPAASVENR